MREEGARRELERREAARPVVLATEREYAKGEAVFRAAGSLDVRPAPAEEEALSKALRAARSRAAIIGADRYSGPLYAALADAGGQGGAIIARFGVGMDGVDLEEARRRGIVVTNTPGALDASVAEHTIWLLGNLARHVSRSEARLRAGEFAGSVGVEVAGKALAVLGLGSIGRRVAAMARFGLGMRVLAFDRLPPEEMRDACAAAGVERYSLDVGSVLAEADFVSLHLAATPETRRFLGAERLSLLKPGALLVNTARGALIDESALHDALVSGRVGGAALDVFETEPYRPAAPGKDLRTLTNVLLTPHIGSNTREANERMARSCLQSVASFLTGEIGDIGAPSPPRTTNPRSSP